ncbi:flavin reductase family protein [Microbispora sp. ATCC PTA-5024]|uniref:flavin reductase family protein n=1 Tax=Microbispora sp. ATCC PTA-5024 TaxID=316330 RepID=UPI0001AB3C1C|nr:flavin reductase family protein [Microbispora sp. ATCC PTA-5024]ETK34064.1 flavin reductase [Microbispora sp. ATCC PTA-5024]
MTTGATVAHVVEPDGFRAVMATLPAAVAIVTAAAADGRPWGMTCSSVCSVTLTPPTLLVCLRTASPTLAAVVSGRAFSVNLLCARSYPVAELFASAAADRFDRVRWRRPTGTGGPHLADDARAVLDCRLSESAEVGDHMVVFGEVRAIRRLSDEPPLMYGYRRYAPWPADRGPGAVGG